MIRRQWPDVTGSLDPYVAEGEIKELAERHALAGDKQPTVDIAKRMARAFHVSGQAMQIRLVKLNLILLKKPPPTLFG